MRRYELTVAISLAAAGLLTIAVLIPRFVAGDASSDGLSPAFMPYVAAALATLAACGMAIESFRRRAPRAPERADRRAGSGELPAPPATTLTRASARFLVAAAAVLGASYLLMTFFGYVTGGIALTAGLLKLARVRPVPLAIAAVAAPTALWLIFVVLLATPLP